MNKIRSGRTELLLGAEGVSRLAQCHVLVLGTGGVGGYAVEHLARAGIGKLTLVDGDRVDESNCNRQIAALTSSVGRFKAEILAERCREINPEGIFTAVPRFLRSRGEIEELLDGDDFSGAVDAIDELRPKIEFLLCCRERKLALVSSMGAGGKLSPARISVADIGKTEGCPLARAVRQKLRERGVTKGIRAVFSPEPPLKRNAEGPIGSISYLPALFGGFCAAELLAQLRMCQQ